LNHLPAESWWTIIEPEFLAELKKKWASCSTGDEAFSAEIATGVLVAQPAHDQLTLFFPRLSISTTATTGEGLDLASFLIPASPSDELRRLWEQTRDKILRSQAVCRKLEQMLEAGELPSGIVQVQGADGQSQFVEVQGLVDFGNQAETEPDYQNFLPSDGFDDAEDDEAVDDRPAEPQTTTSIHEMVAELNKTPEKPPADSDPRRPAVVTDAMRTLDMLHAMRLSVTQVAHTAYMRRLAQNPDMEVTDGAFQVNLSKAEEDVRAAASDVLLRYFAINSKDDDLRIKQ
jgi:hypothetical protein